MVRIEGNKKIITWEKEEANKENEENKKEPGKKDASKIGAILSLIFIIIVIILKVTSDGNKKQEQEKENFVETTKRYEKTDDEKFYDYSFKQLIQTINGYKNYTLNAVYIVHYGGGQPDVMVYEYIQEIIVKPKLFRMTKKRAKEILEELRPFMPNILELDEKAFINKDQIREIKESGKTVTFIFDENSENKELTLELTYEAMKKVRELKK